MKKDCPPEVGISVFDRLRLQLQKNGCHPYTWVSNPVEQYMIDFYNRASKAMVTHERPLLMAFWTSSWLLKNEVSLLVGAPVYVILQQFDTEQFVLWGPLFGPVWLISAWLAWNSIIWIFDTIHMLV